jgi:hypothetical protein
MQSSGGVGLDWIASADEGLKVMIMKKNLQIRRHISETITCSLMSRVRSKINIAPRVLVLLTDSALLIVPDDDRGAICTAASLANRRT